MKLLCGRGGIEKAEILVVSGRREGCGGFFVDQYPNQDKRRHILPYFKGGEDRLMPGSGRPKPRSSFSRLSNASHDASYHVAARMLPW